MLLRRLHLWLGLGLGLLFVVLGITGSALVFYIEIDAALNRDQLQASVSAAHGWESPIWDRALATARQRWTDPSGEWSFEASDAGGALPARYYPPSLHHGHHAPREMVWFSSDGRRVVCAEPWGGYAMSWIYELHAHLLAGETGRQIVGWSGLGMLALLISGIAAWWPRGSWRKALAFKSRAAPIRRLRDLHKHFGLWSAALLLTIVGTGFLLALPDIKTQLIGATIATPDPVPAPHSTASAGREISIAAALSAAHRALPDAHLAFIDVPGAGDKPFRLRVQVPGDPHRRFPGSFIFVDRYSGKVLAVRDIRRSDAGTRVAAWIRALHDGSAGGTALRLVTILIGLVPAILFGTGMSHLLRRRKAARNHIHHPSTLLTGGIS